MAQSNDDWYRVRRYIHLDRPISRDRAAQLVTDPDEVSRHAFLPFIWYEKTEPRYKFAQNKVVDKVRPIAYASHADSHIFAYYAGLLSALLEKRLREAGISESVLAYRRFPGGKCNVHFAHEAFDIIRQRTSCVAVAIDVEQFFDSLNHAKLKTAWSRVLGVERLPSDHYAVFRAITSYARVDREALYKEFGIGRRARERRRTPLCTPSEFRSRVRDKGLIDVNGSGEGIPQGSPISAVLSNLYMLQADEQIEKLVKKQGGAYRRYSDDILIVCDPDRREALEEFVIGQLGAVNLTVNETKTTRSAFSNDEAGQITCDKAMQYLGFTFDGHQPLIRSKTFARYQQRVRRAIHSAARAARKSAHYGGSGKIRRHELYERYSHLGKRNFISYAYRAAETTNNVRLKRQVRRHWKQLNKLINDAELELNTERVSAN